MPEQITAVPGTNPANAEFLKNSPVIRCRSSEIFFQFSFGSVSRIRKNRESKGKSISLARATRFIQTARTRFTERAHRIITAQDIKENIMPIIKGADMGSLKRITL